MDLLIKEVDEDVRRERIRKFWQAFGRHIVTASFLLVLGVIAVVLWQQRETTIRERETARLLALDQTQTTDEEERFKILGELAAKKGGVADIARLRLWQLRAENPSKDAKRPALPDSEPYRSLAELIAFQESEAVTRDAKGGPFHLMYKEISAIKLLQDGRTEEARDLLYQLAEGEATPSTMRQRAQALIAALGSPEKALTPGQPEIAP